MFLYDHMHGRIYASRARDHNYVRVCSSHTFYIAQIKWSIRTVADYWHGIVDASPRKLPLEVPPVVRFCLSWIIGTDCTDEEVWSANKLHAWLCDKLGEVGPKGLSGLLRRIADHRRTAYHALYELHAPPPVYEVLSSLP